MIVVPSIFFYFFLFFFFFFLTLSVILTECRCYAWWLLTGLWGSVNFYLIFFLSILRIGNFYSSIFKSTETFSSISNLLLSPLGESFISVIGFFTSRTSLLFFIYNFYFLLKISICWFIVIISFKFLHLVFFSSLIYL